MTESETDYARLLPFRDALFPTFKTDQAIAASAIASSVLECVSNGGVTTVVDVGCGTGEILDTVRQHLVSKWGVDVTCVGVDCCSEEIGLAKEAYPRCQFVHAKVEDWIHAEAADRDVDRQVDWHRVALLCVGHTLPHFGNTEQVLEDIARLRPACIVADFHNQWDEVATQLSLTNALPIRKSKEGRPNADGTRNEFVLTTRRDNEDEDRVLRGIEMVTRDGPAPIGFWTSQLRRESQWF